MIKKLIRGTANARRAASPMDEVLADGGSFCLRDLFHRTRAQTEKVFAPRLEPDESVAKGARNRDALVLVHGHYWKDGAGHDFEPLERAFLFEPFRRDSRFAELCRRYRVFRYLYPTHAGYAFSATNLASAIEHGIPQSRHSARDVTIVAHSMGGLISRYAVQHPSVGERLRSLVTLATPHHGTILASMVMANGALHRKIGWLGHVLQRLGRRIWHPTAGMLGMSYDNADGRIDSSEEEHIGIAVNHELARLNQMDRYLDRITCLMGRVRGWWLQGRTLWDQIPRWFMGRHDPIFHGLDPLVHLESGIAEGLPVRARYVLDDLDHEGIVTSRRSHNLLYGLLLYGAPASAA